MSIKIVSRKKHENYRIFDRGDSFDVSGGILLSIEGLDNKYRINNAGATIGRETYYGTLFPTRKNKQTSLQIIYRVQPFHNDGDEYKMEHDLANFEYIDHVFAPYYAPDPIVIKEK